MITKIQKDESLRYILTWLSDLLMDEEMLLFFSRHITLYVYVCMYVCMHACVHVCTVSIENFEV